MSELLTMVIPGKAMYASVHFPNKANGDNKYSTDLLLNKDGVAQAKEMGFKIKTKKKRVLKDELEKAVEDHMDADEVAQITEKVTGIVERNNASVEAYQAFKDQGFTGAYINIKLKAEKGGVERDLTVIDAAKNVMPKTTLIGNGSDVKVKCIVQNLTNNPHADHIKQYGAQAYFIPGDQPTMQVINLVEYTGTSDSDSGDDFDTVKGGYVAPTPAAPKEAPEADDMPEDDIPF